jgi:photosystem II stability/assembly factor-like uncharacterized protein
MTVTTPPRKEIERDRNLEEQVDELEALIKEARRRARRRRMRNGAAALVAAGLVLFISFGGDGDGGGVAAALAPLPGAQSPVPNTQATPPLSSLPPGIAAYSFAFDPRTPDTVYAAAMGVTKNGRYTPGYVSDTRGYVYKTVDGGQNWEPTATPGGGFTRADALAADARRPGTLYAGNVVAVYKTVDGGRNWRPWNRGLFPPPGLRRSAYYGTPGTMSWNRGEGWITDIKVDPANSSIVYSAAEAVRKSTDGGHTWKTVFIPPAPPYARASVARLVIAATRPETIYAMVTGYGLTSIYKSTDAGATWQATGGRAGVLANSYGDWFTALAVDAQQPTTVYAAIHQTVVKTTDAGASWQPIMHSQPEQIVTSLAVDPQQPDTVFAGVQTDRATGGIYQTTDGGRTWRLAVSTVAIHAIAINPSRPTTIYAAGWAGRDATEPMGQTRLLRSTDRGRTWTMAR